jgi:hypothetical protein
MDATLSSRSFKPPAVVDAIGNPKTAHFTDTTETAPSLAAYETEGKLRFAATATSNPTKSEWTVDTNLTAQALKGKTETNVKAGLRPSCITAYAWDGAVRYCVIWVKEPPKK